MAPVEVGWTLNKQLQDTITAPDGVEAVLDTPVGRAIGKLDPDREKLFGVFPIHTPPIDRLGTRMPGDPEFVPYASRGRLIYHTNTIFDFLIPKERKLRGEKTIFRSKEFQVPGSKIEITITGYDPKP